jgi:hypothetical protein
MTSVSAANGKLSVVPNANSYFYETFACQAASSNGYNTITFLVKGPAGAFLTLEIQTKSACSADAYQSFFHSVSGLTGATQTITVPLSSFAGANTNAITSFVWSGFSTLSTTWEFGNIQFACSASSGSGSGSATASRATSSSQTSRVISSLTVSTSAPAPTGQCTNFLIDDWTSQSRLTAFTIALQQHNSACDETIAPYPETWDSLEAARYATTTDIYIPMNHFNNNKTRAIGIALKGFYKPDPVTLTKIEIVKSVPANFKVPTKLPSGNLIFACERPNSTAFAIDDGSPEYAQEVISIIKEENIKVTFSTVGAPLLDPSTNLSNVYNEMVSAGHQIALHSYTHPKMESLPDYTAIDWEYNQDIAAVKKVLPAVGNTHYFRPPFGNEGARMRQRLSIATNSPTPYIVNWSVDVEDWLWA